MIKDKFTLLHADAPAEALKFLKLLVYGVVFIDISATPVADISRLPLDAFHPIGFMMKYFSASMNAVVLSKPFLICLKLLILAALMVLLIKKRAVAVGAILCVLLTFYHEILRGFGYPSHRELVFVYPIYVFILFEIADGIARRKSSSLPEKVNVNALPIVVITAMFCLSYMFVGVYRIVHGGIEIYTSDSLPYWIIENSHEAKHVFIVTLDHWLIDYPWFRHMLKIGFPIGTIMETLAPFCLVSRRFRYLFIAYMIPFHLLNWIFIRVVFWENMIMFILLVDYGKWFKKNSWLKRALQKKL